MSFVWGSCGSLERGSAGGPRDPETRRRNNIVGGVGRAAARIPASVNEKASPLARIVHGDGGGSGGGGGCGGDDP